MCPEAGKRPPDTLRNSLESTRLAEILPAISTVTASELHRTAKWSAVQRLPKMVCIGVKGHI